MAIEVSLVIPMKNEGAALDRLFSTIEPILAALGPHEIICINDGSSDDTLERLLIHARRNGVTTILDLSRNFGKEAALAAGLNAARGRCVIPFDADLQDPVEVIPPMVAMWRDGFEVVNAVRSDRSSDSSAKRLTARFFYWSVNHISEIPIPHNVGDFRLLDRKVVDALNELPERVRFNKGLFAWIGFRQGNVEYARPARTQGTTKFNYWRLWNFALDGIFSFSSAPLRIWSYLGSLVALSALVYALVVVLDTLLHGRDVPGYSSTIVILLFFSGMQMVGLGVLGEYLARVFVEVKGRPVYVLRTIYNADELTAKPSHE